MSDPNSTQRPRPEEFGITRFGNLVASFLPARWTCPNERRLAEFADGALPDRLRLRLESHLSHCQRCRVLLSDVIKAQRESDPISPSPALKQRAEALYGHPPTAWQSIRLPLGALATAAIIILSLVFFSRKPQELAHSIRTIATAPNAASANAERGIAAPAPSPAPDVERKPVVREDLPIVLFPRAHSALRDQRLKIRWRPIRGPLLFYRVTLTTSNGDLVWEGQSEAASLELPADVHLKDGAYFVWIAASTTDGRTLKSKPVRFEVKR